jgi:Mg2+/Co2+ transporter CorB
MSFDTLLFLILTIIPLVFAAIFSATETAITGSSKSRIHKLKLDGDSRAALVSDLKKKKEVVISTILLASNVCHIFAASYATSFALKLVGETGVIYVTIIMTFIIVLFTEVLPKTYAIANAEKVALVLARFLSLMVKLIYPITFIIRAAVNLIYKIFNLQGVEAESFFSAAEEIRGAINYHHHEGSFKKSERDMLDSILNLGEADVTEIMVHRKNVFSINIGKPVQEILKEIISCKYSYIPIWKETPDNIIGVLSVRDILKGLSTNNQLISNHKELRNYISPPWFIPETISLRKQLDEFRNKRQHFAIVVDEYGSIEGIVTLKDILDEIVGRIEEGSGDKNDIKLNKNNSCIVDGSVTIRNVNRATGWSISDEEATTIAGLLIHVTEKIPDKGETFIINGIEFTIMGKKDNQITKIKLTNTKAK